MKLGYIKQKLKHYVSRAMGIAKEVVGLAFQFALKLAFIAIIAVGVMKAPEIHSKYLRVAVGSKVYMIRDNPNSGGGTGFAIKAPSGKSYIMTNDHVCRVSSNGTHVLVTGDDVNMYRRIIAHDPNSDLCLIEGIPGVEGLDVATSGPSLGDYVSVVGHPALLPKHVSYGEITGQEDISILKGPMSVLNPETMQEEQIDPKRGGITQEQCQLNKQSQEMIEMDMMFFKIKVRFCVETVRKAYTTGIVIFPGNSGSPLVNF